MTASNEPRRVQLSRKKGWRMPENTVSVARPGPFGNPWTVAGAREAGYSSDETVLAQWCVELFEEWVTEKSYSTTRLLLHGEERLDRLLDRLPSLRGKNLACWCKPGSPCHADVLLELANPRQAGGHHGA